MMIKNLVEKPDQNRLKELMECRNCKFGLSCNYLPNSRQCNLLNHKEY